MGVCPRGSPQRPRRLVSALEAGGAHMHVGACAVFDGPVPAYEDVVRTVGERLHLVPRYRQRLAFVPLQQGRPVWWTTPVPSPFHIVTPPCRSPAATRSYAGSPVASSPGARPRAPTLGAVADRRAERRAFRAGLEDPSRARRRHLRRRHRKHHLRFEPRPAAGRAAARGHGCRARCPRRRSCWQTRCSSARPSRARRCAASHRWCRPA